MQGKSIRVLWQSNYADYDRAFMAFLNTDKQVINTIGAPAGTNSNIYTIPANTKWIRFYISNVSWWRLYEIGPKI